MANISNLQDLIASLNNQHNVSDQEKTLKEISTIWRKLSANGGRATEILKGNKLLLVLSQLLKEKEASWRETWPGKWTDDLVYCMRLERDYESDFYPFDQIRAVFSAFRSYILGGCMPCLQSFRHLAPFRGIKQLLLQDDEFYTALKKPLDEQHLGFFFSISGTSEWKLKLLSDTQFTNDILACPDSNPKWNLVISIAQHPDAKTLLPTKEVIKNVSLTDFERRTELCALLCNEDDLNMLELTTEWLDLMTEILQKLISHGKAVMHNMAIVLLTPLLPIVNLSNVDTQKELLGKRFIYLLKQVITDKIPETENTTAHLVRSRQEASKALWNFAYLEANRVLVAEDNGLEKLKNIMANTDDATLKQNIAGILHMYTPVPVPAKSAPKTKGHVMISYNWGNQPIVKNIAKSLQENGYNVWLDIEQMNGSTLEAMAHAVEQAETVLICMSQKYKDSPNCRLEGEYCVNRKIRFIPLMMQKAYRPDGWLGITLGSKLYYEFTDEENWDVKMTELVKAIGDHGKCGEPVKATTTEVKISPVEWTDKELHDWTKAERIDHHYELLKKHKFNRRALLELQQPHLLNNPAFFFAMWEKLGVTEYGEILQISAAIRNLK